jgi:hypothetical protein
MQKIFQKIFPQNLYNIKENQGFYDSTVTKITHISFTNNDMAINCQMTAYKIPEVNIYTNMQTAVISNKIGYKLSMHAIHKAIQIVHQN